MKIDILTLFPEMFAPLKESIVGRAVKSGKVEIVVTDIREYTENKHKKCDDYPFGGGAGMVMMPQPIYSAMNAIDPNREARRIFMSPKGRKFDQSMVKELLKYDRLVFLCGHYEGVDQRAIDLCIDEEISLGDFVLTGGEIPAMAITDCICRYIDGVISGESLTEESISSGLLEYPQYTRPQEFMGLKVPDVLVSGNHKEVEKWRAEQAKALTEEKRPDLAIKYESRHEMKLKPSPFESIKTGDKRVEMRLYDEKRAAFKVGDEIEFTNEETGEKLGVVITKLKRFANFKALYGAYDKKLLGYKGGEEANPEDMTKYYSKRQQKKYGVVAIEIELK